jgi:hypothetical protein
MLPKMFSDKEFADGVNVAQSSGFVAAVIVVIGTAVIVVEAKLVENNGELRIFAINRLPKEGLIIEIVNGSIADGRRKIA